MEFDTQPSLLDLISFWGINFLVPTFWTKSLFCTNIFFGPKIFWTLNFLGPNIFRTQHFFRTQNFSGLKCFPVQNVFGRLFSEPKFFFRHLMSSQAEHFRLKSCILNSNVTKKFRKQKFRKFFAHPLVSEANILVSEVRKLSAGTRIFIGPKVREILVHILSFPMWMQFWDWNMDQLSEKLLRHCPQIPHQTVCCRLFISNPLTRRFSFFIFEEGIFLSSISLRLFATTSIV